MNTDNQRNGNLDWKTLWEYAFQLKRYEKTFEPGIGKTIRRLVSRQPKAPYGIPDEWNVTKYNLSSLRDVRKLTAMILKRCQDEYNRAAKTRTTVSGTTIWRGMDIDMNTLEPSFRIEVNEKNGLSWCDNRCITSDYNIAALKYNEFGVINGRMYTNDSSIQEEYKKYDDDLGAAIGIIYHELGLNVKNLRQEGLGSNKGLVLDCRQRANTWNIMDEGTIRGILDNEFRHILVELSKQLNANPDIRLVNPQNWNGHYYRGITSLQLITSSAINPRLSPVWLNAQQIVNMGLSVEAQKAMFTITKDKRDDTELRENVVYNLSDTDMHDNYPIHGNEINRQVNNDVWMRQFDFSPEEEISQHSVHQMPFEQEYKQDQIKLYNRIIDCLAYMQIKAYTGTKSERIFDFPVITPEMSRDMPVLEIYSRASSVAMEIAAKHHLLQYNGYDVDMILNNVSKDIALHNKEVQAARERRKIVPQQHR